MKFVLNKAIHRVLYKQVNVSIVRSENDSASFFPLNKSFKDTEPFESLDSYKLIVLVNNLEILPVPEWAVLLSFGTACPTLPLLSTPNLTASQSTGATCHSSSNLGTSPCSNNDGFTSAALRYEAFISGFCIYKRNYLQYELQLKFYRTIQGLLSVLRLTLLKNFLKSHQVLMANIKA